MARLRYRLVLPALLLGLAGCAGPGASGEAPQTAAMVDLQRYQGTWYEQARLPMFFQRHCAQSEAHYRLQEDGAVGVLNRCRTLDGEWLEARGRATPQVAGQTDKLWVRFDNGFSRLFPGLAKGDYWVLYLDGDYRAALVGNPSREYLWLLSREAEISLETRAELLEQAQNRGYDTSELIWRVADARIGQ